MPDIRARIARMRHIGRGDLDNEPPAEAVPPGDPVVPGELFREGRLVRLRAHVPGNREAFQRWYADEEIARLLRHDQRALGAAQSRTYFDTLILPGSASRTCYAIHETATDRLIGTTALTDFEANGEGEQSAFFRIVIGEKECWGQGFGTEATELIVQEAFEEHGLDTVKLEVFAHNDRARRAYLRVGFEETGRHIEWVGRERWELHVVEMALTRTRYEASRREPGAPIPGWDAPPEDEEDAAAQR
jgi:RimJ/RimL family protein N-acetyltransferase